MPLRLVAIWHIVQLTPHTPPAVSGDFHLREISLNKVLEDGSVSFYNIENEFITLSFL